MVFFGGFGVAKNCWSTLLVAPAGAFGQRLTIFLWRAQALALCFKMFSVLSTNDVWDGYKWRGTWLVFPEVSP